MRFLADSTFAPQLAQLLDACSQEHCVEHLHDHFRPDVKDTVWIPAVAKWKPRPVVLTADARILTRAAEADELREADLTWFSFKKGWTNITFEEQSWKAVQAFWEIVKHAQRASSTTFLRAPR